MFIAIWLKVGLYLETLCQQFSKQKATGLLMGLLIYVFTQNAVIGLMCLPYTVSSPYVVADVINKHFIPII